MTDETLAEILSGQHTPTRRAELHTMLDQLMDAADADAGMLYSPAFWAFISELGRGRGIAADIASMADAHIAKAGGVNRDLQDAWRAWQWAALSALLERVTAYPGELMPREFSAPAFRAVARNVLSGKDGGELQDLLGLGTQRGSPEQAARRAGRLKLVRAVYFYAAQNGMKIPKALSAFLPTVPLNTFRGWEKEASKLIGASPSAMKATALAAAQLKRNPLPFMLDTNEMEALLKEAHWPDSSLP